jgi:lipoteichoic acid synthase
VKHLLEQYKELGLYEETIFVLYGDHGEAFGEHGLYQHDNVAYEEGLRVPLL